MPLEDAHTHTMTTCFAAVQDLFPFKAYFADAPEELFRGRDFEADMERARGCWRHLRTMFQELEECRAFELLKARAPSAAATAFCFLSDTVSCSIQQQLSVQAVTGSLAQFSGTTLAPVPGV